MFQIYVLYLKTAVPFDTKRKLIASESTINSERFVFEIVDGSEKRPSSSGSTASSSGNSCSILVVGLSTGSSSSASSSSSPSVLGLGLPNNFCAVVLIVPPAR